MSPEFAAYEPRSPATAAWTDASVRDLAHDDVVPCARLLSEREGWAFDRSKEMVSGWLDSVRAGHFVLGVHRRGELLGYARARFFDSRATGGEAPAGWYLLGIVVAAGARRHGIGTLLTAARLRRIAQVADEAWYFANVDNHASIALHEAFGFHLHRRDFTFPGVEFEGGGGALYRCDLMAPAG